MSPPLADSFDLPGWPWPLPTALIHMPPSQSCATVKKMAISARGDHSLAKGSWVPVLPCYSFQPEAPSKLPMGVQHWAGHWSQKAGSIESLSSFQRNGFKSHKAMSNLYLTDKATVKSSMCLDSSGSKDDVCCSVEEGRMTGLEQWWRRCLFWTLKGSITR